MQDLADGKGCEQGSDLRGAAHRAITDPLDDQSDQHGAGNHHHQGEGQRQVIDQTKGSEIGCHHHDIAVGKVDQAQDAEHHGQADGHQGVQAAQAKGIDQLLDGINYQVHASFCSCIRYRDMCSLPGGFVSSSPAGPSSMMRPLSIT